MRRYAVLLGTVCVWLAATPITSAQENADAGLVKQLLGTWRMVAHRYGVAEEFTEIPPEKQTTLKHFTATGTMWVEWDPDSGKVLNCAGGTWSLKGDQLTEMPAYGLGPKFDAIKGKEMVFTLRVQGDRWMQSGAMPDGWHIEETWERVPAAAGDDKDLAGGLVGTWRMAASRYEIPKVFLSEPDLPREGEVTVKHVTPTHFLWATRDPQSGLVRRCLGGTWVANGGKVVEKAQHGLVGGFGHLRDQEMGYTCKRDGDRWEHAIALEGGVKVEETWERWLPQVEAPAAPAAADPAKADGAN